MSLLNSKVAAYTEFVTDGLPNGRGRDDPVPRSATGWCGVQRCSPWPAPDSATVVGFWSHQGEQIQRADKGPRIGARADACWLDQARAAWPKTHSLILLWGRGGTLFGIGDERVKPGVSMERFEVRIFIYTQIGVAR